METKAEFNSRMNRELLANQDNDKVVFFKVENGGFTGGRCASVEQALERLKAYYLENPSTNLGVVVKKIFDELNNHYSEVYTGTDEAIGLSLIPIADIFFDTHHRPKPHSTHLVRFVNLFDDNLTGLELWVKVNGDVAEIFWDFVSDYADNGTEQPYFETEQTMVDWASVKGKYPYYKLA